MKKHLLALATGLLLGGAVPQIATAQVANPAENPERFSIFPGWGCELTYYDKEVEDEYKIPPHLENSIDRLQRGPLQGLIAKGWFWVRFTEYPFVTTLRNDTVYHYTDVSEGQGELRTAFAQLEERFGSFVIATATRAGNQPCELNNWATEREMQKWSPLISAELPYFFLRFDNYISIDTMYKYLWHLPKTAKWFEFGDFSSREGIDSVEQWMVNVYGQDGWSFDYYMYYPHEKALGYIFQGVIPVSVEEQTSVHTPVFQCYPNPAFTQMEIRLFKDEAGVIDIVNAEGAVMQRYSVDGATTLQADVSALPTGTYFVRYGNTVKKIMIGE